MATRLYIGNLPFETTEGDVMELFSQVGKVVSCNLIVDKFTNKSRGFAFVEMSSQAEADKAIAQFNDQEVFGRALRVNEARPKEESPRAYGGGGGGGHDRRRSGGGGRRDFRRD